MSALDIRQAKQSLAWWLREWGVTDDPDRKARQFIDDLTDRGWIMSANREARPQPPRVDEACRRCGLAHPCACERERLAATFDDEPTTDENAHTEAEALKARIRARRERQVGAPTEETV